MINVIESSHEDIFLKTFNLKLYQLKTITTSECDGKRDEMS